MLGVVWGRDVVGGERESVCYIFSSRAPHPCVFNRVYICVCVYVYVYTCVRACLD